MGVGLSVYLLSLCRQNNIFAIIAVVSFSLSVSICVVFFDWLSFVLPG